MRASVPPSPPGTLPDPVRRSLEVAAWVAAIAVNVAANSATAWIDIRDEGLPHAAWEPVAWEASSGIAILALLPAVAAFTRAVPLQWDGWRRTLGLHVLGSIAFSLLHVAGMVMLRHGVYAWQGMQYDFGDWPRQLGYEYLKDVRAYAGIVAVMEAYRFLRRRRQGEASLLVAPDVGPPVEPLERPERFLVRKLGREFLVASADVEWLQAAGNYVNLRVRGRDYPLRTTMAAIEGRLDPARFARIHRSYMVNLGQVASIEPIDTGDARVHLHDGTVLPCSRRHREALRGRANALG